MLRNWAGCLEKIGEGARHRAMLQHPSENRIDIGSRAIFAKGRLVVQPCIDNAFGCVATVLEEKAIAIGKPGFHPAPVPTILAKRIALKVDPGTRIFRNALHDGGIDLFQKLVMGMVMKSVRVFSDQCLSFGNQRFEAPEKQRMAKQRPVVDYRHRP
ncbi:hypothetical protein A9L43_26085 [Pseudomonas mosselii]|nr:hypothetical protein A9L43_26085 [Pseudomonas mosselii]